MRLSRSSSLTRRDRNFSSEKGLRRSSPRVRGRLITQQLQNSHQPSAVSKTWAVEVNCFDYTPCFLISWRSTHRALHNFDCIVFPTGVEEPAVRANSRLRSK